MSNPDETHHEPSGVHDEHAAKTGEHPKDEHGHDAPHHETAADFIPENSAQDQLLKLVTAVAGIGLIIMMAIWYSTPIDEEHGAVEHTSHAQIWEFAAAPDDK